MSAAGVVAAVAPPLVGGGDGAAGRSYAGTNEQADSSRVAVQMRQGKELSHWPELLRPSHALRSVAAAVRCPEDAAHDDEEDGNEEHGEEGAADERATHHAAIVSLACRSPRPSMTPAQHAEDERERGHHDRTLRRWAASADLDHALALCLQVFRELDDQDRVLRRQPDDGDQAHLEVDVVGQPAPVIASSTPTTPIGTTRITDSGIDQLVQRCEREEHREDREAVQ